MRPTVASQQSADFYFPHDEQWRVLFNVLFDYSQILFCGVSVQIFCSFLNWLICLILELPAFF